MMESFGEWMRYYRRQSVDEERNGRPLSQERLGELIGRELGFMGYSGAAISNWENGKNHIAKDERRLLIALIKVLYEGKGIQLLEEANNLLRAGNYRSLDFQERQRVHVNWKYQDEEEGTLLPSLAEQEAQLPPPNYTMLIGVEPIIEVVQQQLVVAQAPWVVSLVGLGGSGKTAVADAVARHVLQQNCFDCVIWLSMNQLGPSPVTEGGRRGLMEAFITALGHRLLPDELDRYGIDRQLMQLRHRLKAHRYLVIIDNLEYVSEAVELFAHLNNLANPSKFLLTMRAYPPANSDIFIFQIPELSRDHAVRLLREQAAMVRVSHLTVLSDESLAEIVAIVGGHPQALRLMPRLARIQSLARIEVGWQRGQAGYIQQTYEHVYGEVWQSLSFGARTLLRVMPLVAHSGAKSEHLQAICMLADDLFWTAITQLIEFALLELRGSDDERRYGIHRLTHQFLSSRQGDGEDDAFIDGVVRNLLYWEQQLKMVDEKQFALLDSDRHNVFLAIQFAFALPAERMEVLSTHLLVCLRRLYDFVEKRGYWHEWLMLLEEVMIDSDYEPLIQVTVLGQMGKIYRLIGQLVQAVRYHQRAQQVAYQLEDAFEIAQAHFNLATSYLFCRRYGDAHSNGMEALEMFTHLGLSEGSETAATLNLLGLIAQWQEGWSTAENYLVQAATLWRSLDRPSDLVRTLNNQAIVLQNQQKEAVALQCYTEAKSVLRQTNNRLDWVMIAISEGSLYFRMEQLVQAEACFKAIDMAFLRRCGHVRYQALILNNLGLIALRQEVYEDAEQLLREAVLLWQQMGETVHLANTLSILGDCWRQQGKPVKAQQRYKEAIDLLQLHEDDSFGQRLRDKLHDKLEWVAKEVK